MCAISLLSVSYCLGGCLSFIHQYLYSKLFNKISVLFVNKYVINKLYVINRYVINRYVINRYVINRYLINRYVINKLCY